jgi:hypothetical protein
MARAFSVLSTPQKITASEASCNSPIFYPHPPKRGSNILKFEHLNKRMKNTEVLIYKTGCKVFF